MEKIGLREGMMMMMLLISVYQLFSFSGWIPLLYMDEVATWCSSENHNERAVSMVLKLSRLQVAKQNIARGAIDPPLPRCARAAYTAILLVSVAGAFVPGILFAELHALRCKTLMIDICSLI